MKSYLFVFVVALIAICISTTTSVNAQDTANLNVIEAKICRDVVNRAPVDSGPSYPASVGRLFCYTRMGGGYSPTEVTHVWYFGDVERAKVKLPVKDVHWRTWSSKIIQSHEVGQWFVDVIEPGGKVLQTLQFKITP